MKSRKIKIRKKWIRHPATRIKKSDKLYDRQRMKKETKKEVDQYKSDSGHVICQKCSSEDTHSYVELYEKPGINRRYHRCRNCLNIYYIEVPNDLINHS